MNARPAPVASQPPKEPRWFLFTEESEQFGPVSRLQLGQWLEERRVTPSCQVRREDWPNWRWAGEVFPAAAHQGPPPPPVQQAVETGASPGPVVVPHDNRVDRWRRKAARYPKDVPTLVVVYGWIYKVLFGGIGILNLLVYGIFGLLALAATKEPVAAVLMLVFILIGAVVSSAIYYVLFRMGEGLIRGELAALWGLVVLIGLSVAVAVFIAFAIPSPPNGRGLSSGAVALAILLNCCVLYVPPAVVGFIQRKKFH